MKGAIALLVVGLAGCAGTVELGSLKIAGALMGAAGTGETGNAAATWGNGSIDVDKKATKINRRGVSENLRGVLGDGLGLVLADRALCAIPAVAPSCIGDVFQGTAQERQAAERLADLTEGLERTRDDVHEPGS